MTADTVRQLLEKVRYFEGLGADELNTLAAAAQRRNVAAGQQILAEGDSCEGLFVVIRGQVRLIKMSIEGREHVLQVLGPGATFNDIAVFDGGTNADSAFAIGQTFVAVIPKGEVLALFDRYPHVAKAALKFMSFRQRSLGRVVEDLALKDVTARVARLLLGCIGRQQHILEQAEHACTHITHQEISTMVGSVREVVQRALKQLERDGAITLKRSSITISDAARLERWAQTDEVENTNRQ